MIQFYWYLPPASLFPSLFREDYPGQSKVFLTHILLLPLFLNLHLSLYSASVLSLPPSFIFLFLFDSVFFVVLDFKVANAFTSVYLFGCLFGCLFAFFFLFLFLFNNIFTYVFVFIFTLLFFLLFVFILVLLLIFVFSLFFILISILILNISLFIFLSILRSCLAFPNIFLLVSYICIIPK